MLFFRDTCAGLCSVTRDPAPPHGNRPAVLWRWRLVQLKSKMQCEDGTSKLRYRIRQLLLRCLHGVVLANPSFCVRGGGDGVGFTPSRATALQGLSFVCTLFVVQLVLPAAFARQVQVVPS